MDKTKTGNGFIKTFFGLMLAMMVTTPLTAAGGETPPPTAGKRVQDFAQTLTSAQVEALATRLKAIEQKQDVQMAVLLVPSIGTEAIEPYAHRVFVSFGLGRKGVDNGLLLVFAIKERKMRLEVGRGLEGDIPDVIAKRIIADKIAPHLKATKGQDFNGAITIGINAIEERLLKRTPEAPKPQAPPSFVSSLVNWGFGLLFAWIALLLLYWHLKERKADRIREENIQRRRERDREAMAAIAAAAGVAAAAAPKKTPSPRSVAARSRHKRLASEVNPYADTFPPAYTDYTSRRSSSSSDSGSSSSSGFSSDNSFSSGGGDSSGGGASGGW